MISDESFYLSPRAYSYLQQMRVRVSKIEYYIYIYM